MQSGRKSEKLESQIEQLELKLDELEASRAERGAISAFPKTRTRGETWLFRREGMMRGAITREKLKKPIDWGSDGRPTHIRRCSAGPA